MAAANDTLKNRLRPYINSEQPKDQETQDGFILPLIIVAAFTILLGSLAIANRSSFSVLGSLFQRQGTEAREAAEAGANRIIGELNEPPNRRFLLSSNANVTSGLWSSTELASGSLLSSVCTTASQTLSSNRQLGTTGSPPSTGPYPWVYLNASGTITTNINQANRAYRLVALTRRPPVSHFNLFRNNQDDGWGRFTLQVEGASVINGQITSNIVLEREYQVAPKCCNRSFGGAHGSIDYTFDGTGSLSDCLNPGFGLIGGAAENNTGEVVLRGNVSASDTEGDPITTVYCIINENVGGDCTVTDTASNLNVQDLPADIPDIPLPPQPLANRSETISNADAPPELTAISLSAGSTPLDISSSSASTTPGFFYKAGSGPSSRIVIDANYAPPSPQCTTINTGSWSTNRKRAEKQEVHCLISRIDYQNNNLRIITGGKAIRFYFVDSGTIMRATGNENIIICETDSFSSAGRCTDPLPENQLTDVTFLGCPGPLQRPILQAAGSSAPQNCSNQTIELAGTPSIGSGGGIFLWFPTATIDLRGTAGFTGVAWTNRINAVGTVPFIVPGAGLGNVLEFSGFADETGESESAYPFMDFIARATNSFRWLSP